MKYLLPLLLLTLSCNKVELYDTQDCYPVTEILFDVQTNQTIDVNHHSDMCHCLETTYAVNLLNKNKITHSIKCIPQ